MLKKVTIFLFAASLSLSVFSCNSDNNKSNEIKQTDTTSSNSIEKNEDNSENKEKAPITAESLRAQLIGKWKIREFSVDVASFQNQDTSFVSTVSGEELEQSLGYSAIITDYKKDGTYITSYLDGSQSVATTATGSWDIIGNILLLNDNNKITRFYLSIDDDYSFIEGQIDWDGDGNFDDTYRGTLIRQ